MSMVRAALTIFGGFAIAALGACVSQPSNGGSATPETPSLTLPAPSGPYAVGVAHLHLIDQNREDPFVPEKRRELMVSVWYPATATYGYSVAPYMSAPLTQMFSDAFFAPMGVDMGPGGLSISTHTYLNAPADTGDGDFPVVLFSPGGGVPRAMTTQLVEDLASNGYIVVSIDHTHEPPAVVFSDGRIANAVDVEDRATRLAARITDARFVLDVLELIDNGEPAHTESEVPANLAQAMDLSRIGMFGHSAGGFTAVDVMVRDDRLDAVANLDGSVVLAVPDGPPVGEAARRGLDRPFLLIGAATRAPGHSHETSGDWGDLWDNSNGWKRDVTILPAKHMSFVDQVALQSEAARRFDISEQATAALADAEGVAETIRLTQMLLTAFFDLHLKGTSEPLFDPEARPPEGLRFVP